MSGEVNPPDAPLSLKAAAAADSVGLWPAQCSAEALREIVNGCSGGVSWLHKRLFGRDVACVYCCDEHDLAYYEGGTAEDRRLADQRLRECVIEAGFPVPAWLMWAAVRVFGKSHWGK